MSNNGLDIFMWTQKDCDSGVHTVVNLANSFNTDVGYSSETSRAASHPSSVAFKRRTFTNKSASQNYSSPTESLGSQAGHGDAGIGCYHHSPLPSPMDGVARPGRAADPRRLSYKRFPFLFFFLFFLFSLLMYLFQLIYHFIWLFSYFIWFYDEFILSLFTILIVYLIVFSIAIW